jgi:hypothetical protein
MAFGEPGGLGVESAKLRADECPVGSSADVWSAATTVDADFVAAASAAGGGVVVDGEPLVSVVPFTSSWSQKRGL